MWFGMTTKTSRPHRWKVMGNLGPTALDSKTRDRWTHLVVHAASKQFLAAVRADRQEVCARRGVIEACQPETFASSHTPRIAATGTGSCRIGAEYESTSR